MPTPAESAVQIDGPWSHRSVSANGTRFHVVESGDGPLVLLLHGFPEFWWSWRYQLPSLARAGFRAVAADLRGYGGSDKPPRGYDLVTAASDVAGLIRSLGEANAVVVGHDWGALVAWTVGVYYPKVVRRLAIVSAPHPLRMNGAVLTDPFGQGKRSGYALAFQLPATPERRLVRDDGAKVGMRVPIESPTLQLHGALDACVLPRTARGSGRYVDGPYRWRLIDGAGHFPHEELPDRLNTELCGWLADPEPER